MALFLIPAIQGFNDAYAEKPQAKEALSRAEHLEQLLDRKNKAAFKRNQEFDNYLAEKLAIETRCRDIDADLGCDKRIKNVNVKIKKLALNNLKAKEMYEKHERTEIKKWEVEYLKQSKASTMKLAETQLDEAYKAYSPVPERIMYASSVL